MKIIKWITIIIAVVVVLIGCTIFFLSKSATDRLSKVYDVQPPLIAIPSDSASLARGEHLSSHCTECHGQDLSGILFFDDQSIATMYSPNLTTGIGSSVADYTDVDWIRAIRHGIRKDGTPVFIMPSKDMFHLSESDLGALIAYVKTVPAVDHELPGQEFRMMGKVLLGAGAFGPSIISAEVIDHKAGYETAPLESVSVEYGEYLVKISGCPSCHGQDLNGFKDPNPHAPIAPNLTAGGKWGNWGTEEFIKTMRTGITPDERKMDPKFMPWLAFMKMTDDELTAIDLFLQSVPAMEDGVKAN